MKKYLLLGAIVLAIVGAWAYVARAASSGPNFPTSAIDQANGDGWTNPTNIEVNDGIPAYSIMIPNNFGLSGDLFAKGFGFSIPTGATISGVTVEISEKCQTGFFSNCQDLTVELLKGGIYSGNNKANVTSWATSTTTVPYGGSSDLWGNTFTVSDINSANFGVGFNIFNSGSSSCTAYVDFVRITITYTLPHGPAVQVTQTSGKIIQTQGIVLIP